MPTIDDDSDENLDYCISVNKKNSKFLKTRKITY